MELSRDLIAGSAKVLRRPHFRRTGDELFFLISCRPHVRLSASEAVIWEALESEPSVDDLRKDFPGVETTLSRFLELGISELVPTQFPANRQRVLVFEPHSDDAVLSVGGTMWLRRNECEFTVLTIGSRSNFTSYYYLGRDYFNVDEISSLRFVEGTLFTRLLGGRYQALDEPEAALRYQSGNWSLDWYREHRLSIGAFITHRSSEQEQYVWTEAIRSALRGIRAEEIWFPLGGSHTDHRLTRDACLYLMRNEPALFQDSKIRFYQDVPYAARSPEFTPTVLDALIAAGAELIPEVVPITSVFAQKMHLVSLYASQFKIDAIGPEVERSARMATGDDGLAERFWLIHRPPTTRHPQSIPYYEPIVRHAAKQLGSWMQRNRNANRIRLLLLPPAGRWAEDMQYLLQTFPKASFDAYVADTAETQQFKSPRTQVNHVGSGPKAWGLLALRLMLMRPAPTLFLAGEKQIRTAELLSLLWPMADPIVLPTMDDLVTAMRSMLAEEPRDRNQ